MGRSLQSLLGFSQPAVDPVKHPDQSRSQSKLEKVLFDDFDDVPMSSVANMSLPSAPTISTVQHVKKSDSVSGLSDLFGEDSDSSSFLSSLPQSHTSTSQSASFSGSLQGLDIKTENSLLGIKTESPGLRREESDKRRSSDKGGSTAEKKARPGKSGLFSPSPPHDSKHDLQFPSLISPLKQEQDQKRNRTTSSSSNNDAIVNVQKLENLAPEFQAFKGLAGNASIVVGPDGLPSPGKVKKESFKSPVKEKKAVAEDKRRISSGHSKERQAITEAAQKSPEDKSKEKGLEKDHKKKKDKKDKKDKKEKKHKKDKKRDDESKELKDEERKHKKEKKKSKDKDKERERKVKIMPVAEADNAGTVPKLKIIMSGTPAKKDSRKRDRSASSAKLDKFDVPAAKMARATGSDRNVEAKFLEENFKKREKR